MIFSSLEDFKPINQIFSPTPQLFEHDFPYLYIDYSFDEFYYLFTSWIVYEIQFCLFVGDKVKGG
jgi:hypothetical protein